MSNVCRVRIQASQYVHYDQIVQMTREQWDKIKSSPERRLSAEIDLWLDTSDVSHAEDIDEEEIEIFVCDESGKPVKPEDRYVGEEWRKWK